MSELHISISAETISNAFPIPITNSMFSSVIVSGFLIFFALMVRAQLQGSHRAPTGLQNIVEFIFESIYDLVESITNNTKKTLQFFPLFTTFALFILFNNWSGLLPGMHTIEIHAPEVEKAEEHASLPSIVPVAQAVTPATLDESHAEATKVEAGLHEESKTASNDHTAEAATNGSHTSRSKVPLFRAGTADINMTLALGIVTVVAIQYFGISYLGISYFGKFINFSSPIAFFVGVLELVSEFSRIISFAFRLFGNVFAGEVLLIVIASLSPIFFPILPVPFYGLELFVGFIQAVVFGMLSLVLYNMATISHSEH